MLVFQVTLCIFFFYIIHTTVVSLRTVRQISDSLDIPDTEGFADCMCVAFYLCDENNTLITSGAGLIDIRHGGRPPRRCDGYQVCCKKPKQSTAPTSSNEIVHSQIRNSRGTSDMTSTRIIGNSMTTDGSTSSGEFPWMVAVLKTNSQTYEDQHVCGGSVIHRSVVLTAAHCLEGINVTGLKIRAGEWDTQSISESLPHQDRFVSRVVIHPQYRKETVHSDVALLFLTSDLVFTNNVGIIFLPEEGVYLNSSDCIATGWGKNNDDHTGQYQSQLKKVDLPLVLNSECQEKLRSTQLGRHFILDQSFLCAGGIEGKDTCQGDGGGPLVCRIVGSTSSYAQVGITSWGIGCGTSVPGVYASVIRTLPWIKTQLESIKV